MKPERWQQIETLYHAARERAPHERAAFMAAACAEDSGLRDEVEALLRADEVTQGLIDGKAPRTSGACRWMAARHSK